MHLLSDSKFLQKVSQNNHLSAHWMASQGLKANAIGRKETKQQMEREVKCQFTKEIVLVILGRHKMSLGHINVP